MQTCNLSLTSHISCFELWSFYLDHSEFGVMFSGVPTITFESVNRSVPALPVGLSTCP